MQDFDLIAVGGGLGGLAAAVRAYDLGLSVLVLEKSAFVGGVAAYSGGAIWAPGNHLARAKQIADTTEAADAYMDYVGGSGLPHDQELRSAFLESIPKAIAYYQQAGIAFSLTYIADQYWPQVSGSARGPRCIEATVDGADLGDWYTALRGGPYSPEFLMIREIFAASGSIDKAAATLGPAAMEDRRRRRFLTRGRGLTGAFLKAALARKIRIELDAGATELVWRGGRVTGVVAKVGGETVTFNASKCVLLATGGYGRASFAAAMEGLPELHEQSPPILDGDALTLIEPTPAAVVRAGFTFVTLGYRSETQTHPGTDVPLHYPIYDLIGRPHIIIVNAKGERFGDESFYGTFVNSISAYNGVTKEFSNFPAFAILDDRYRRNGYSLGRTAGFPERELKRANSIDELASMLELDPVALTRTVNRFNTFCESGKDEDFRRGELPVSHVYGDRSYPNPNLGSLAEPPFWGIRLNILTAGIYSHGLSIDRNARVLSLRRDIVPGLYATGNCVAHSELPFGYENGFANARNIAYAFNAANHAAEWAA